MGVEQDHRRTDQSDGEAAGSKGSSYRNTVPRIMPMNGDGCSSDAGIGDKTATARPRLVTVTGCPSPCKLRARASQTPDFADRRGLPAKSETVRSPSTPVWLRHRLLTQTQFYVTKTT